MKTTTIEWRVQETGNIIGRGDAHIYRIYGIRDISDAEFWKQYFPSVIVGESAVIECVKGNEVIWEKCFTRMTVAAAMFAAQYFAQYGKEIGV